LNPLRSGLRAFGAWRSVGLAANLTLDYHAACGGAVHTLSLWTGHLPFGRACAREGGGGSRP